MKAYLLFFVVLASPAFGQQLADNIALEVKVDGLARPWAAEALPDGRLLVSEMEGSLKLFNADYKLLDTLAKPKDLDQRRIARFDNAGAFDVIADPDFEHNQTLYWTYSAARDEDSLLVLDSARIEDNKLCCVRRIAEFGPANDDRFHYGGALLFDAEGNLLVATGERFSSAKAQGDRPVAQDPEDSRGKLWRFDRQQLLSESPVFGQVVASGLRNVQALARVDTNIWLCDHGPIRGDEINQLKDDGNYGWPVTTAGRYKDKDYQPGTLDASEMIPPLYHWQDQTMAPSGMLQYTATRWPDWQGQLFISGLSNGKLQTFRIIAGKPVFAQELLVGIRLRDVLQTADGRILILSDKNPGQIIEVRPTN